MFNVWVKKSKNELYSVAMNINAKFEGKLTLPSKMTKGIWKIFTKTLESLELGTYIARVENV